MRWLGSTPGMRMERHYGSRLVRCFCDRPASVNALLAEAVGRFPTSEALVADGLRLDYRTLDDVVARVAHELSRLGVAEGDRVAVMLVNSADFVVAFLAVLRLGAVAVPMNTRESLDGIAYMLADCGARALIYHGHLECLPEPSRVPDLEIRIPLGRTAGELALDTPADTPRASPADIGEEAVAAILYTSGTTGRPKGAMLTHMGLVHAAMIYEAAMGLGPADRSLVSVPLSHVTGITAGICAMLRSGGALIVMETFKAQSFIALAAAERMTHTVMVPAMYTLCLLQADFARADLSAWRVGGYGGAPMPVATIDRLAERLPQLRLFNAYGSTETTGPVVLMPPSEARARSRQVGTGVPTTDVLVMDEAGRETPRGVAGEIWLKGPNVVAGYWGNPDATAEAFVDGYWRSGDIGALDEAGYLTLLDRAKDMVNRGGYKVYSVEVENVLAAHPQVIEAAIVARPCPVLGERVHAFVVAEAGFDDAAHLLQHAASHLADYKVPETLTFHDGPLPRNAGGKVLKRELRASLERPGA